MQAVWKSGPLSVGRVVVDSSADTPMTTRLDQGVGRGHFVSISARDPDTCSGAHPYQRSTELRKHVSPTNHPLPLQETSLDPVKLIRLHLQSIHIIMSPPQTLHHTYCRPVACHRLYVISQRLPLFFAVEQRWVKLFPCRTSSTFPCTRSTVTPPSQHFMYQRVIDARISSANHIHVHFKDLQTIT